VYWDYTGNTRYYYRDIAERFGVEPERYADYLALTGDAVDHIPGVPGVGPKTAVALMRRFASLEALYDGLDEVANLPIRGAGKLAARLLEHRDAAYLARQLTLIHCEMPLTAGRLELRRRTPDHPNLHRFCDAQGFGALLRRQAERLTVAAA
jgi:5'-3' exonuclease